jgi:hypothetical protein
MAKSKKKPISQAEIIHRKFLQKMGVTKLQLKERKAIREEERRTEKRFNPDTIETVRRAYE